MKTHLAYPLLVAGLLLAGCTTPTSSNGVTAADIPVEFQNPDGFRDVRDSLGGSTDENALAALRTWLQENARQVSPPARSFGVTFTDIDLAGEFLPGSGASIVSASSGVSTSPHGVLLRGHGCRRPGSSSRARAPSPTWISRPPAGASIRPVLLLRQDAARGVRCAENSNE